MFEVFEHTFFDTIIMLPFLFLAYLAIEIMEMKTGQRIFEKLGNAKKSGPLVGAAFGCVPQCGFSVISTTLYNKRLITTGTLLAVYLSTSDEAIPIILSQPGKAELIWPLLISKIIIAVVAGFSVDFIENRLGNQLVKGEVCAALEEDTTKTNTVISDGHHGCCGHSPTSRKMNVKELITHPLVHTLKVFGFIILTSFALNLFIHRVGEDNLSAFLLGHSVFQPLLVALVGLIPNCASSVAITQVFLMDGIGFGAAIAGLSSGAGLGLMVLFKENPNFKDSLRIMAILYLISAVAGIIIQMFYY